MHINNLFAVHLPHTKCELCRFFPLAAHLKRLRKPSKEGREEKKFIFAPTQTQFPYLYSKRSARYKASRSNITNDLPRHQDNEQLQLTVIAC